MPQASYKYDLSSLNIRWFIVVAAHFILLQDDV